MNITGVVATLTILREQLAAKGMASENFDELIMTEARIKLKRGTKTMTIPLQVVSCVGAKQ